MVEATAGWREAPPSKSPRGRLRDRVTIAYAGGRGETDFTETAGGLLRWLGGPLPASALNPLWMIEAVGAGRTNIGPGGSHVSHSYPGCTRLGRLGFR